MNDDNDTHDRLAIVTELAETLAERLLTRSKEWDDTAYEQRLTLMRVALLLDDMGCPIPDIVIVAIEAGKAGGVRDASEHDGAAHPASAAEHAPGQGADAFAVTPA